MDERTRCLKVLGLDAGASEEEIGKAYRELVMVWHPDRFANNSPLQAKAEEKLRQFNLAYERLTSGVPFEEENVVGATGETPEPAYAGGAGDPPQEEPIAKGGRSVLWLGLLGLALLAGAAVFWWKQRAPNDPAPPRIAAAAIDAAPEVPEPAPTRTAPDVQNAHAPQGATMERGLMNSMRPVLGCVTQAVAEGLLLSGEGRFVTLDEYSPPFALETTAKTDLTNIRLYYGKGVVIFNWELNPNELRFHDPRSGQAHALAGKGRVPVGEWVDLRWVFETNGCEIFVNGQSRGRFENDYNGMHELAGIGPAVGSKITVRRLAVKAASRSRPPADLSSGLVLYYPFDSEESEVVTDHSAFRNHGKAHRAGFNAQGKIGGAFDFRGNPEGGAYVLVPHSPSLVSMQQTRQLTICAWIKPRSLPKEYPVIVGKGGCYSPTRLLTGYELLLHAPARWDLVFQSAQYGLVSAEQDTKWIRSRLKEWTHVAVVVNAAERTRRFYINGHRVGDETDHVTDCTKMNVLSGSPLYVGSPDPKNHPNRAGFDGLIDELRVYARALRPDEIRALPGL